MRLITPQMVAKIIRRCAPRETSEDKLWCAVVCRAAEDAEKANVSLNSQGFMRSSRFKEVCELAGLDVEFVRGLIKRIGQKVDSKQQRRASCDSA